MRAPAPITHDAQRLARAVLERLDENPGSVPRRACALVVEVAEQLVLAANGRAVDRALDHADESLVLLRLHLRLAETLGALTDAQLVHVLELADLVGRQLGGWRRARADGGDPS